MPETYLVNERRGRVEAASEPVVATRTAPIPGQIQCVAERRTARLRAVTPCHDRELPRHHPARAVGCAKLCHLAPGD